MPSARTSFVFVAALALLAAGCSQPIKAPTSYAKWEPKETMYHMEYPEGWKADGNCKQGIQWAEFTQGTASIKLNTDQSTNLIGDIAGSASSPFNNAESGLSKEEQEELAPVARAHDFNKKAKPTPDEYGSYKEEDKAIAFNCGVGDGRKSIFTAKMSMGRKVKGYRVTLVGRDRGVVIYCHCNEKDWKKLQPAFDKVLETVKYGDI
jgi:hypothetical protein